MTNRVRDALRRLWTTWLWRGRGIAAVTRPAEAGVSRSAARARFWTEFREGQREAEAHLSRLR